MDTAFFAVLIFFVYLLQECNIGVKATHFPYLRIGGLDGFMRRTRLERRGNYSVLYNYVKARRRFSSSNSVTFATHGHYNYLYNLKPLLEQWRGPVSLAMHAPGKDFDISLKAIDFARTCIPLVTDLVTFHIFYEQDHEPPVINSFRNMMILQKLDNHEKSHCNNFPPWSNWKVWKTYTFGKEIRYPVNVARNIARESATTHFVLSADIDLYPSTGLIDSFLNMVRARKGVYNTLRVVFPIPVFEIRPGMPFPQNKSILVNMLKLGTAIPFHQNVCALCHIIPHYDRWINESVTQKLDVFNIYKRVGELNRWEPIYIGTKDVPTYDERLLFDGQHEKMEQAYALCLQDYTFLMLDNAFLFHKPGIPEQSYRNYTQTGVNHRLIHTTILKELNDRYGSRNGCVMGTNDT